MLPLRPWLCVLAVLVLSTCEASRPREPRLQPRVLLTDPQSAYLLDLLNLRLDQPTPTTLPRK